MSDEMKQLIIAIIRGLKFTVSLLEKVMRGGAGVINNITASLNWNANQDGSAKASLETEGLFYAGR